MADEFGTDKIFSCRKSREKNTPFTKKKRLCYFYDTLFDKKKNRSETANSSGRKVLRKLMYSWWQNIRPRITQNLRSVPLLYIPKRSHISYVPSVINYTASSFAVSKKKVRLFKRRLTEPVMFGGSSKVQPELACFLLSVCNISTGLKV